jgi:para-nitrobenzyl esterase
MKKGNDMKVVVSLLLTSCLVLSGQVLSATDNLIKTNSGRVAGKTDPVTYVTSYLGIPYAKPPIGDLRWLAPQALDESDKLIQADKFANSCMQDNVQSMLPWTEEYMFKAPTSEDCLALNIWAPVNSEQAKEKLPVLVYVHGGAFTSGSGDVPIYDGTQLARQDIIVVTFNYRLGIFGFYAHPELSKSSRHNASGNYGLLDQIQALRWVKSNIESFGGDPENITLAGQSAGAASVHYLIASPMSKGLFHKAIAQSGPWNINQQISELKEVEALGANKAKQWGNLSLAQLREMPAEEIQKLPVDFQNRFLPNIDGWMLPTTITKAMQNGAHMDVPMIVGVTADEASFLSSYRELSEEDKQKQRFANLRQLSEWAKFRADNGKSHTYTYLFNRPQPWPEHPNYGAFHSSEVAYVFNNLHLIKRPWTELDSQLATNMSSFWVSFIKTGNPTTGELPEWTHNQNQYYSIGEVSRMKDYPSISE